MSKLTDVEKQIIDIELEKSRLNREKSILVLNKSLFLYFAFLFVAVIGFVNGYISKSILNLLIVMGLVVLIIGTVPYIQTMKSEEKNLDMIVHSLKRKET